MDFENNSAVFKALGHPVRLRIVAGLLDKKECNVGTMVKNLKIPQSTASQHLGILRAAGIITPHKKGVETCYAVTDARVKKILADLK